MCAHSDIGYPCSCSSCRREREEYEEHVRKRDKDLRKPDPRFVSVNNPEGKPTGAWTGRCGQCGSADLWSDETVYGCNKCRACFPN